jgi:glycosyltransferase involved in cell wall biosynthesis
VPEAPLVSIVVATYNRWPLLRETIQSALAQSFSDFEVVVVDDASTDGTADHVRSEFPQVRLIRQEENSERGAAYNHGVREARGRYVSILGSDDVCEPWHLAQFDEVRRAAGDRAIFAGRAALWDPASSRTSLLPAFDTSTIARDSFLSAVVAPQAMLVKRSAFLEVGGYPEDRSTAASEDWVLHMKLFNRFEVTPLPRPSVRIREHPGRSMANLSAIRRSREATTRLILEGDLLGFELDPAARKLIAAGTHRLCAAHHYGAGEMREARMRIADLCRTVGLPTGIRWAGRLWLQTWMGPAVSAVMRRAKQRLTWRTAD